jgi:hypothetical protein
LKRLTPDFLERNAIFRGKIHLGRDHAVHWPHTVADTSRLSVVNIIQLGGSIDLHLQAVYCEVSDISREIYRIFSPFLESDFQYFPHHREMLASAHSEPAASNPLSPRRICLAYNEAAASPLPASAGLSGKTSAYSKANSPTIPLNSSGLPPRRGQDFTETERRRRVSPSSFPEWKST